MKKLVVIFVLLGAGAAYAGYTQVSPSLLIKAGSVHGRSDGVYQDTTSQGLWMVSNGQKVAAVGVGFYEDFSAYGASKGISCLDFDGSTCAGDATTVLQVQTLGSGLKLASFPLGTATAFPITTATGLDITGDTTNDEGFEVASGIAGASGRPFIVGDDPAFYACITLKITDVSGSDLLMFGFRRAEAMTATFANYADYATIGSVSGDIYIKTELNGGGQTSVDTTDNWADLATKKLCVFVSGAGVTTFTIDGSAPTTTSAFTFDDGDPIVPFVHLLHDTDVAETTAITKWEQGFSR